MSKELWTHIDQISTKLRNRRTKLLMLDFDGTISPIVKNPKKASLPGKIRKILLSLSKKEGTFIAVISGRELENLQEKVGIDGLIYGGNHGIEGVIFGKNYLYQIDPDFFKKIKDVEEKINMQLRDYKEAVLVNKKYSLTLNYENIPKEFLPEVKVVFNKIIKPYIKNRSIKIIPGKNIFDIMPDIQWNKGLFARMLLKQVSSLTKTTPAVLFIGDDITDEYAFTSLDKEITVRVGNEKSTKAKYTLENIEDVFKFLRWIDIFI